MSEVGRKVWSVLELLRWTTGHFAARGIRSARLDAECLLAHALECDRLRLYLEFEKPVEEAERERFRALVRARANERVPVAYLTGVREFWSLSLRVTPDVLIPRPETEALVEAALEIFADPAEGGSVLEVGTGSGAVALALAIERPALGITATDCSVPALKVARENARRLECDQRIRFLEGDLLAPVVGESFDAVVSNPPYLARSTADCLEPELRHEPEHALFGGETGDAVARALICAAPEVLAPGGTLAMEIDPRHRQALAEECAQRGFVVSEPRRDLAGDARVLVARWRAGGRG